MVAMGKRVTETDHDVEPGKRPRGGSDVEDMNHDGSMLDEEAEIMNGEEAREFKPTHKSIAPITPAAKDYTRPPLKNMNASSGNYMALETLRNHSSMSPVLTYFDNL